ncbi:MAG: hypothetical protein ACLFUG_05220 [Nitriliruptoraceae bacterium]
MRRRRVQRTFATLPVRGAAFGHRAVALLVVLALGGVVTTAAAVDDPASSAGSETETGAVAAPDMVPAATDDASEEEERAPEETAAELALRTVEVSISRDPFDPVRPEAVDEDGDGADDREPADPDDPSDPADPADPDDPAPPDGDGTSADRCVDQGELVCDGEVVTVVATTATGATVTVGSLTYEVEVGERFGNGFTLVSIDGDGCAVLGFGSQLVRGCPGSAASLK